MSTSTHHSPTPSVSASSSSLDGDTYVDLYDNDVLLGSARVVNENWTMTIPVAIGEHKLVAKISNLTSDAREFRRTAEDIFEDFENVPLQRFTPGVTVNLGKFNVTSFDKNQYEFFTGIVARPGPGSTRCMGIHEKLRITLHQRGATSFSCVIANTQRQNIYRFYLDDVLIETFTPALPIEATFHEFRLTKPYSILEVECAMFDSWNRDYIELDNIRIGY